MKMAEPDFRRESRACRNARKAIFKALINLVPTVKESLLEITSPFREVLKLERSDFIRAAVLHALIRGLTTDEVMDMLQHNFRQEIQLANGFVSGMVDWYHDRELESFGPWIANIGFFYIYDLTVNHESDPFLSWDAISNSILLSKERPTKFIFTTTVPSERYWEDWYTEKLMPDDIDGMVGHLVNPYSVTNSESSKTITEMRQDVMLINKGEKEYIEAIREDLFDRTVTMDWDPESSEAREQAFDRINKDFKSRLRKHLRRLERKYRDLGFGDQDKPLMDRDAKWLVKRVYLSLEDADIYRETPVEELFGEGNRTLEVSAISQAIYRLQRLAYLTEL